MKVYCPTEAETKAFARSLAASACPGGIYCLTGTLGAGKTVFAKGFAEGLGICGDSVTSPTFTLMNVYNGERFVLYHFDVYRLSCADEFISAGCEEYLYNGGICLIEWADLIRETIPETAVWIDLTYSSNGRMIHC
jgi:tRNA threonylcarbamoyladenosine biosynthesis protein TsaE